MTTPRYVGIDIGGTKTAAIVIDDAGSIGASIRVPTEPGGGEGVLRTAQHVIDALAPRPQPLAILVPH